MMTDAQLNFVPVNTNLSIVAAAGVAVPGPVIIDLLGTGVGTAPQNFIGTRTLFGEDPSIGGIKIQIEAIIGTAFTTANGATLNVQFQGAPDTGVGGNFQPGAFTTYAESGPIAVANLTAGQVIRLDWPAVFPEAEVLPRFIQLNFAVPALTNFTAGTIASAITTMVRDDYTEKFASKNFVV
jgi:hypothetical protein